MKKYLSDVLTVIAASAAAILLAVLFNAENYISAGIIAILTIQPTKRETLKTAVIRLVAFVCALLIAAVTFNVIGYNVAGFIAYLVIYIALCERFKWISAMAVNSVLISHFISFGNMSLAHLGNEALIFILGVGMGILVNLRITGQKKKVEDLRNRADEQIRNILRRMSERIKDKHIEGYDGACLRELDSIIDDGIRAAKAEHANTLLDDSTYDIEYIKMRNKQYEVLLQMYNKVRRLDTTPETAQHVSLFLEKVSREYSRDNDVKDLISSLDMLHVYMDSQPLPSSRKEFEDRALLYALLIDLRDFLEIKREFADAKPESLKQSLF
jgi:uncharacterized membrane protein YgaE (UPF0421/DUF939 family)